MEDIYKYIKYLNNARINTTIKFSHVSKQWYVHTEAEVKEGIILRGICEHRNSVEECVIAFNEAIKGVSLVHDDYKGLRTTIVVL